MSDSQPMMFYRRGLPISQSAPEMESFPAHATDGNSWSVVSKIKQSVPVYTDRPYDRTSLVGKTILITGGASGFGAAFAREWASQGSHVIIGDIDHAAGEKLVAELRALPGSSGHHFYQPCDVTKWKDQVALFKAAVAASPRKGIDAVAACAGIVDKESAGTGRGFENPKGLDSDDCQPPRLDVMAVNLTAVMYTVHLALFWLPRNGGRSPMDTVSPSSSSNSTPSVRDRHLLLVGSLAGLAPLPGQTEYTTSKHGVTGLFRALRGTTWRHGIRCNLIAPYFVPTPMLTDMGRVLLAGGNLVNMDDVVDAATRLMANQDIIGRGLCVSPRFRLKDTKNGKVLLLPAEEVNPLDRKMRYRTDHAVWDFYAHDYEQTELFVYRIIGLMQVTAMIRGWIGVIIDLYHIFLGRIQKKSAK